MSEYKTRFIKLRNEFENIFKNYTDFIASAMINGRVSITDDKVQDLGMIFSKMYCKGYECFSFCNKVLEENNPDNSESTDTSACTSDDESCCTEDSPGIEKTIKSLESSFNEKLSTFHSVTVDQLKTSIHDFVNNSFDSCLNDKISSIKSTMESTLQDFTSDQKKTWHLFSSSIDELHSSVK